MSRLALLLTTLCGVAPLACAPAEPERPPNLVLISLDDLGAAHVGAYGSARDTTPFLDGLAGRGVLFEQAQSQATWTLPSHASLLSSRTVGAHGAWRAERRFPEGPVLLPEVLRDAGWKTAAFTSCDFVSGLYGLDRGFDRMETLLVPAEQLTARVLESLPGLGNGPFLLFLHYYDVHQPFTEPNPYGADFAQGMPEDQLEEAWRLADLLGRDPAALGEQDVAWLEELFPGLRVRHHLQRALAEGTVFDERIMKFVYRYLADQGGEALQARRARYDNGVANMDHRLSQLFVELAKQPWFDDTVFVITSDHGESFNEPDGVIGHGGAPYREQMHVPLVLVGRGIPEGLRIPTPVASIDIAPTLLELAGVAAPEGFQGRSFGAALRGGAVEEQPIVSGELQAGSVGVRGGRWNLVIDEGHATPRLFDLTDASRADLSGQHPEVVDDLRSWLTGLEERNARLTEELDPGAVELDEETRARLIELGYLR